MEPETREPDADNADVGNALTDAFARSVTAERAFLFLKER